MDGSLTTVLMHINETGGQVVPYQKTINDEPWFWTRMRQWIKMIENVHMQSLHDPEQMLAPIEDFKWLDKPDEVKKWYESRRPKGEH